jgi:hypothetical protein
MHRASRAALAAGVVIAAALLLRAKWAFALELMDHTRGMPPEQIVEALYPGVQEVARLVAAAPGPVFTMPPGVEPVAHQWLLELVYPRRPRPYDPATLRAGDLVVLPAGRTLELPNDEVLGRGLLRVVRVR